MKQYEYILNTFSSTEHKESVTEFLNTIGLSGWQLCAVVLTNMPYCTVTGNYFFKRTTKKKKSFIAATVPE